MEDFVWIFVVLAVWLFEIAGKGLKKQRSSPRVETDASRAETVSRTERSRELDASARRAEDALQRWEAGQQEQPELPASPVPAATHRSVTKTQRRREALESIAAMLATPGEKSTKVPATQGRVTEKRKPREIPESRRRDVRPQVDKVEPAADAPPVVRRPARRGIAGLAGLPELQRAVVLSEILGLPVSLERRGAFYLESD